MATNKLHQSVGSSKSPDGFQNEVVTPCNSKLVTEAEEPVTLTPSAFLKEMSLTTEQRLASTHSTRRPRIVQLLDMSDTSHQKFSSVDLDQTLFQPFPSEVVFQSYIPCEVYEVPLVLRNNDRVPRLVKVVLESSPYFKLISPGDVCRKVAPGMASTFRILFTPEENKDYFHQLTCITEREKFVVPIRAIGARAILDFPDQLNFSVCPVKHSTQRTLLVRNVGNREARYHISTHSPFSVDPSIGTLGIGDTMQVTVEFHPLKTGDHCESLVVHYDTGEDVVTSLYGAAVDVNIRLDRNSLMIAKTYLTLANHRSVVIHNRSEIIAHFQWKAFVTQEEEDQQKLRLCHRLRRQEQDEMDRFIDECVVDPSLQERLSVLSRVFQNHRAKVQGDSMLFSDDVFAIEPVEGDVWPNSSAEINVIFRPREARLYQQTVYCDISGRETRLPLRIRGEGEGPRLRFSFDQLDIGKVFVGSAHSYEAILFNKGAIDALFHMVPPSTALGSCFAFVPREGLIPPGGLQHIHISFCSTILGQFTEEFGVTVHGCPQPVTLTVRGCVIGPTFHFDVPSLCFGDVSFGFPHTLSCRLSNTSLVPMTFSLRIPGDGSGAPSVSSSAQVLDNTHLSWRMGLPAHPKPTEFTVMPCRGTIRAQGTQDVQVTLCSNTVKQYEMALVVDVDGVGKEVLALLLTARCVVPLLRVLSPVVPFGRCFLQHPYQRALTLVNDSDVPGCYGLLPQEHQEGAAVRYSSPAPCGIIQPHSSVEVPVTLQAQVTGKKLTVASVAVFGREGSPLEIHLVSTGEGPVVYVHPSKLNFGRIPVLQDASQTLHLFNQAVIPASFWTEMDGKDSRWRVEPNKGIIPPETEVSLAVIANLNDTKKFQDNLNLFIQNSSTYVIPVQAVGIGTTIVTDKPFAPELNLGPHFSLSPCSYHFKITNKGRRTHQLYWTTEGFAPFRQRDRLPAVGDTKDSSPQGPVFRLRPLRMELMPGRTMDMTLEGFSSTPRVVTERLLCHAIIGSKAGKTQIMQVDVTCEFIAPVLQLSSREITFRVEKQPSDVLTAQHEPLHLKNISSLPLSVVLLVEQPFSLCNAEQQPLSTDTQPLKLKTGEERHLSIRFNPAYKEDLNIRVVERALKIQFLEHPLEEHIAIRGEVYFPNLHMGTTAVDFGCILNDTEDMRYVEMTNCSPLLVRYRWSFLAGSHVSQMRFSPPVPKYFIEPQPEKEEGAPMEPLASADSSSHDMDMKEPDQAVGAAGEPAPEPADADGPLEAQLLPPAVKELESAAEMVSAAETQSLVETKEPAEFVENEPLALGMEEVFNILPLYGELQPGESQQVTFTFFGHANLVVHVTALCEVQGGPTYEVMLSGEASVISYLLDATEIDCGLQLFNEVAEAELTLQNSGKVGFQYQVLSPSDSLLPGVPLVLPSVGYVGPSQEQVLKVFYLPGVPGAFCRTFQIQVGHLEPETITLKGEGSFPRICLDLPRNIRGNEKYENTLQEARQKVEKESRIGETVVPGEATATETPLDDVDTLDIGLQMQMEEMLVEEHALEQQKLLVSCPPEDSFFDERARRRLLRVQLPEYVLDFGYVILGNIHAHIVNITNTGRLPVSFYADGRVLRDTGFTVELDRVTNLPYCETETFEVRFDPQSANVPLGAADVLLPIKVTGGPTFHLCLRACVTVPSLCISRDSLEFSTVQCGQCQEETIQLYNQFQVPCKWFVTLKEPVKKVDKHLPASVRRKLQQELKAKPCAFEVLPSAGDLAPGQRCNMRVRFTPTEERSYRCELKINICQSSQPLQLQVSGHGLVPQLEFNPPVLELGPLLPYSSGTAETVLVKNPCEFPIEFYSLEFDQQYLAEEQILRVLKDYDCRNTLLLPPRAPGEKLPPEVLEYYQDQKRLQDEQAESRTGGPAGQDNANGEDVQPLLDQGEKHSAGVIHSLSSHYSVIPLSTSDESQSNKVDSKSERGEGEEEDLEKRHGAAEHQQGTGSSKEAAGELDDSPVLRAIARHLGVDISPESRAAQSRRGIVIIIHGAPLTGKTSAAVALSRHYGTACLSIDSLVMEAISDRNSSAGLRARELCLRAAIEQSHKETEEAGQSTDPSAPQLGAEPRHSLETSQSSSGDKTSLHSISSRSRASAATGRRKSDNHASQSQKQQLTDPTGSQGSSSSHRFLVLPCVPTQQWLSIGDSAAGEVGLMSCVLPEDVLGAILSERLQLSDCYQGVVFDGLETLFARSMASALLCLLKAVNNRPYIYFVNLFQDYASWKAKEMAAKEQEEREQEEVARREKERLQEMDEEEYDALTEEQKAQFDENILQIQRERRRRMEQLARELEERQRQELERLKEEEELKKKSRRGRRETGKEKDSVSGKKSQPGVRQNATTSTSNTNASTSNRSDTSEGVDKKGSTKEHPDSAVGDKDEKKKWNKAPPTNASPAVPVQPSTTEQEEAKEKALSDSEKMLAMRFKIYEASQKDIAHILSNWDRVQGVLVSSWSQEEAWQRAEEQNTHLSSRRSRKDREKERLEKERQERERQEKLKALEESQAQAGKGAEGSAKGQDVGVPCLDIQVLDAEDAIGKILESGKLPPAEQILDSLGLGPSGPPIPPTAFYSVIRYPEKRVAPTGEALKHFIFIMPEGAVAEEEKKESESLVDAPITPTMKVSEEQLTPTRGKARKEKTEGSREVKKEKRSSVRSKKNLHGTGTGASTHPADVEQSSVDVAPSPGKPIRLSSCRWIVPAHGQVELKVHFTSSVPGQFDQTMNFEVLGTKRLYQLHCRGICAYPTISQDPRVVFRHRRKSKADNDIIFKQYVMSTGVFHFGPLLCGKSRDWYKALPYPSNCEKITILNITPLEAEVHFFFEHDLKADTFIFDPPSMTLKPNEKQELSIWAYPTLAGLVEDKLVCCIKDNPEPVVFRLCCQGVRVELGVSPKHVHFGKLLLHRRDSKQLVLRNLTLLPAAWRLSGLENLGEDFSVSQSEGTVEPCAELSVYLYFKATKALSIKKTIRLEVSDAENILGIVQIENIQIQAEAYDVALSITISKGMDGNVDFGVLRVQDDAKQMLTLKNKGKYEIAYSFTFENADTNIPNLASHFAIQPQRGVLAASERPVHVHLVFHPKAEINIKDKPILKCQVIEPSLCEGGEAIAIIPVKVSAKALFSKYSITPASLIDFGTMVNGTTKTCSFILENKGSLDFRFQIYKAEQDASGLRRKSVNHGMSDHSHEDENVDEVPNSGKQNKQSVQKDTNPLMQARLTLGMFTVYPGFGSIHPGDQQTITVDCQAEPVGTCEEHLSIDISDRDPKDNPLGIPYTLLAESCLPAFVVDDIGSIFEEHRICSNANLCQILQTVQDRGVFITDENKFIFTNVLVGRRATARFKIRNVGKVPCDVVLSIKPISTKPNSRISDIFEVDPVQMCVPSHSHAFATVTFTPQTMQSYQCTFEACLETQASPVAIKTQSLTFDISGEGNLPRVTVLRPVFCNKRGNPLLLFKKLLLGDSEKLPLVLQNSGIIPVQLLIDLLDEAGVFLLKARPTTHCIYQAADTKEDSTGGGKKPHTASLVLHHGESAEFDVLFKPNLPQRVEGQIHLSVVDNPYEETNIQLVGEGYEDDFTLDNIHGLVADSLWQTGGNLEEDVIEAARVDHIQFGDCHIGKPYQVTFTVTNRSQAEAMRFEWLAGTPFHFSPQVGHLHAGCAKDITVTLKSDVALTCQAQPVKCKVSRISFQLPAEQVTDWDDRLHTVKWVDATRGEAATWPVKKKVIETDPEPAHTVLEKSSREVELRLSAVIDYADFKLDVDTIQFKETLLFQTRTFPFRMSNTGNVALEYTWMADTGDERATSPAEELLPPGLEGRCLSSVSVASVKLPFGWLGHALEHSSSSLSSPTSLGHVTPLFSVEPRSGTIPAGREQLFQMKFSPVYVGKFKSYMVCSIPNLKPNQKGPEVVVKGKSLMPYCHFELEDSDYITAKRRKPELPEPRGAVLDVNTRVIEFAAIGVGSRNSRTFKVMNPTSSAYSFQWTCQDPEAPPGQRAFFCLTERGQIQPGKKAEIKFEFISRHLDITESFWVFTIPEKSISVLFLLVGHSTEPLVTLDRSHLNLHLLLVGHKEHQTIYMINREKEAFAFAFRESSLFSEGCSTSVKVEPMEGSIAPLSRFPITVAFTPALEGEMVFNLKCDVKRKTEPLSLNIKATGYSMSVSVRCEDSNGGVTELSAQEVNVTDFKEVQLNERAQRTFSIHNNGKFSFTFSWELSGPTAQVQLLSLSPQTGSVQAEGKVDTQLVFHPRKMCSLKDVELTLQISKGPMFTCVFLATVVVPTVYFSTTRLNFGACFIYQAGMPPARQTLAITNKADKDVSLSCLFTNTMHLEVDFPGYILRPGGTVKVPITFYPREVASYHELIPFEINGLCQRTVEVQGKGAEMKVDVVEPHGKVVKLGALSVGQTVKKTVTIANNSVAPLTFKLCFMPIVPELQEDGVLCLHPSSELSLKPKGDIYKVEVIFSPKCRIQPFTEEVMLESSGLLRSLFMVQGSCQGICVSLDQEHLSFGAVVQQSCTSQRITMQNTGDIGVKFKWDVKSFQPDFSISPTKGYISPGMDVPFVVSFHPSKLSPAIRYEGLQCFIQDSEPLYLTLAGCCMETPVVKETLIFSCNVREKHSQTILLSNPSNEPWTVKPVIEGDHWKGPECIHLEGNQQDKPYKITYEPLTMSSEEREHQGSIFFPLPDGTGLYYLLQGTAEEPKCSGTIVREVPCRTPYTELLPISNWLNKPQRFLVVTEILQPEDPVGSSVLHGLEYIDVPGSGKKDYKLTFLSYKEGVFSTMVTFLNEVTEEYLFYMVTFKATASGPIGTVEVSAAVRQNVSSTIKVDNPLAAPVVFDIDCKVPDITVPPHFTVPAQSEANLVFEYQPLKVGESTERLMLHSSNLGSCYYELILKATISKPEKPLYFCTMLGSNQTITTKIMNYNRQKTEYMLQTDCADFQTEKTISMPPACLGGSEVSVEVTYEPCQLGESRATLQLLGPPGGEYSIPLFGLALPPRPQGPFLIKAGGSTSIPFKNIFPQPTAFRYNVENPAFAVRATETLRPKKTIFMAVSFEGSPDGTKTPVSSRLVVSCARADGLGAGISWVFYLRGLPLEK
ncbi:hydrocephalus-inducing protein homolog isoform X3 [Gallus gallus]|uniref:hydrocephalus-inducing protein homolog isoform X3 n=1 Tax=Gallus gallus TaxID=9031 RepID=UPI001F0094AC|nr:hydrocephalus-inducing protein homolog isoform X3 [Gallus gallus]